MEQATEQMRRGRNERETLDLNGWGVGTVLRGHEAWSNGKGTWTTMRITGVGESAVLGRCIKHERTEDGVVVSVEDCRRDWEHMWTLTMREWSEVPA